MNMLGRVAGVTVTACLWIGDQMNDKVIKGSDSVVRAWEDALSSCSKEPGDGPGGITISRDKLEILSRAAFDAATKGGNVLVAAAIVCTVCSLSTRFFSRLFLAGAVTFGFAAYDLHRVKSACWEMKNRGLQSYSNSDGKVDWQEEVVPSIHKFRLLLQNELLFGSRTLFYGAAIDSLPFRMCQQVGRKLQLSDSEDVPPSNAVCCSPRKYCSEWRDLATKFFEEIAGSPGSSEKAQELVRGILRPVESFRSLAIASAVFLYTLSAYTPFISLVPFWGAIMAAFLAVEAHRVQSAFRKEVIEEISDKPLVEAKEFVDSIQRACDKIADYSWFLGRAFFQKELKRLPGFLSELQDSGNGGTPPPAWGGMSSAAGTVLKWVGGSTFRPVGASSTASSPVDAA